MNKPITDFPIKMDIVAGSMTEHRELNRGDTVKCLCCGEEFQVNENTAVMVAEDVPCLRCYCGYTASVVYYFPEKGGIQYVRARHW